MAFVVLLRGVNVGGHKIFRPSILAKQLKHLDAVNIGVAGQPVGPDIVRFVSVLSKLPNSEPSMPVTFPSSGKWLLRILGRKDRFVFGMYRRDMKTIGYLGQVDRLFDVPVTTRNWNTIAAIAKVLAAKAAIK